MTKTFRIEDRTLWIGDRSFPDASVRLADSRGWHTRGAHLTINGDVTLSVQWGSGSYSDNHDSGLYESAPFTEAAVEAEIAVWREGGELMEWTSGDSVEGYVTTDAVLGLIDQTDRIVAPVPSVRVGS